jgi:hypothetical protein
MSSPVSPSRRCSVVDAGKLPPDSGGADALCAAVDRAMSVRAPGVTYSAEIRVLSASRLVATLTREGRTMPEQNFASMDRDLTTSSFERFAQALADQVAKAQH